MELSLGGETLAQNQSDATAASVNTVAQLVPLDESSVALVASLLTLTVSTNQGEVNLESAENEASVSVASLSGSSGSLGQGFARLYGRDLERKRWSRRAPAEAIDPGSPVSAVATPWERFMLGLDQARRTISQRVPDPDNGTKERSKGTRPVECRSPRPMHPLLARP